MPHSLTDTTVLVTGGASGLGLAAARSARARGAEVVVADLPSSDGPAIADTFGAHFVATDVTDREQLTAAFEAAAAIAPLRGTVHCAGRGGDQLRILGAGGEPSPVDSFLEVIRVNLGGTYNTIAVAAAHMARNEPVDGERGALVLTASVAAFDGQIGQTAYTASKAGVHGITLVAARDLASKGIRVNTIAPGIFDTAMVGRLRADVRADLAQSIPYPRRLGRPDEFAALALHVLENPYVNGETIRLDGATRLAPR